MDTPSFALAAGASAGLALALRSSLQSKPAIHTSAVGSSMPGGRAMPRQVHPENAEVEGWLAREAPEPVLEPDLPIVDAHHHLWDRRDGTFPYRTRYYDEADLLHDIATSGHNVVATVYVQAFSHHWQGAAAEEYAGMGEVEYCQGVAAKSDSGTYGRTRLCCVGF